MKYLLSLILFFNVSILKSQEIVPFENEAFFSGKEGFKEAKKAVKEGDENFIENVPGAYKTALEFYLKANNYNSNYAPLNYRIGVSYLKSYDKTKALPFLEKAYKLDPNTASDLSFQLACAFQHALIFKQAIDLFKTYLVSLEPKKANEKRKIIDKYVNECKNGIELLKKPVRCFIENLGKHINTQNPEYGPVISADQSLLLFTSRRAETTGLNIDPDDRMYYEDIYQSTNTEDGWSSAINIGAPLNTKVHDATISLSPDGQRLFVFKGDNGGDIYESFLKGDVWSLPKKLPKTINTSDKENSASISFDGNSLYFSSNHEGVNSYGGFDIYVSKKNAKGEWAEPVNLGANINTEFDEIGVFMMPDGRTMYFSSNNTESMGGFDIYKTTKKDDDTWSKPENIGYPINTPDDDVFFQMAANGHNGYYSTAASDGFGDADRYKITFLGPEHIKMNSNEDNLLASISKPVSELILEKDIPIKSIRLTIVKGIITDSISGSPIEAQIDLYDNTKNEKITSVISNSKTGRFLVSLPSGCNYGLVIKQTGYLFHSENFNIPKANSYSEEYKKIALINISVGSKIILKNIFFANNQAILEETSTPELERILKFMKDYPNLKIEISGHTDNVGTLVYNERLSTARAKSVVDYLISKGIVANRLTSIGFGQSQAIADNKTEEGRQLNRRVEFKVISK